MCSSDHDHVSQIGRPRGGDETARRGAYSYVTPATVQHALTLPRTGTVVPLNLALDTPTVGRPNLVHHARMHNQTRPLPDGRFNVVNDDSVELALQSHTHWDALAHWGVIENDGSGVFYGGAGLDDTWPEFGSKTLGVGTLAGGIVTRGVLFDMVDYLETGGSTYLRDGVNIDAAAVRGYLADHNLALLPGDAAIFYTGFQHRLLENSGAWIRGSDNFNPLASGVLSDTLDIWEAGRTFALVADNPSVEPNPMSEGLLHAGALKRLGIYLGELFDLEALVTHCRSTGQKEFAFMSMPLNLPRAFGSPANALAIL